MFQTTNQIDICMTYNFEDSNTPGNQMAQKTGAVRRFV